jgi:hypothetical protein
MWVQVNSYPYRFKSFLETNVAQEKDGDLKAHIFYGLSQIKLFQKDPQAFKLREFAFRGR